MKFLKLVSIMITTDYNILQFASFITKFYNFSLKTTWPIVIIFYVKQKKFITPAPGEKQ